MQRRGVVELVEGFGGVERVVSALLGNLLPEYLFVVEPKVDGQVSAIRPDLVKPGSCIRSQMACQTACHQARLPSERNVKAISSCEIHLIVFEVGQLWKRLVVDTRSEKSVTSKLFLPTQAENELYALVNVHA